MRRPPRRCAFVPSNPQAWLRPAGVLATAVAVSRLAVLWRGSARLAAEQVAEARRFAEEQAGVAARGNDGGAPRAAGRAVRGGGRRGPARAACRGRGDRAL